jgi:hypothetical protein
MLHVDVPSKEEFKALALARGDACVSIYMPTSPLREKAHANRIAFKDLSKRPLSQLKDAGVEKRQIASIQEQLYNAAGLNQIDRAEDKPRKAALHRQAGPFDAFWKAQARGLGVLVTPESMRAFRLPYHPKEFAGVADRFHLIPLVRAITSPHDALVLALSEEQVRLLHVFVGQPPAIVQVAGLPKNAAEATRRPSVHVRARRGRLWGREGEKVLVEKYIRAVDQTLQQKLRVLDRPLILAASEPTASMFRSINTYAGLMAEGIAMDPHHMTDRQIEDSAIPLLERVYVNELKAAIALFDELKPRRATTDLSFASHAATAGAVNQLLADLDTVVPGIVSDIDGSVTYSTGDDAETYGVVDEVVRRALCTGAKVLGARRDELPNRSPLVAILRYPFPFSKAGPKNIA